MSNPGAATALTANNVAVMLGTALPTGDQFIVSQDVSSFREGSQSTIFSGTLFTLTGDIVMKYWSHNTALDANGNFTGRDDIGPAALMCFTEGIGTNAPKLLYFSSASGNAGVIPTFTQVFSFDFTTGLATFANAVMYTGTVTLTNGAAGATGTLTNAPVGGNPTKWVPISDNGVTRFIPAW